jgi:hypothetical protein
MLKIFLLLALLILPFRVESAEYSCQVDAKYDFQRIYTKDEIKKWQFGAKIEDLGNEAFISRCSFSSIEGKVTCDRYKVDRVEHDKKVGIKKYYVFRSQYNIQLFRDLSFLEDNGRGGISYGRCVVVSP